MPAIVTFELNASSPNVIVEISTGGDNTINALEIFSEWKQWLLDGPPSLLGLPQAFTVLGGEPKTPTTELGQAFFMHSPDWVFRPAELDHKLRIVGDIGVLGGIGSFLVPTLGGFTVLVELERSSLITGLPFLDVAVSTRAAAGDAMSLTVPAEASLADAVWDEAEAAHVLPGSFGARMALLGKLQRNRLEEAPGNPGTLVLYDDDDVTPILTWQLRDGLGGAVVSSPGSPARRTKAT